MSSQEECLDKTVCKQMSSLVELLTTSGKPVLNQDIMKKFKKICRTSDKYIEHAFELLMSQLSSGHSEIRLSTFQIIDELFARSHAFRQLLVEEFQTFLELAIGVDQDRPLPPPKLAAETMKNQAYKSIQLWHEKFGVAYKKLALGYQFLKNCKKVDFDAIQAKAELERRQKEEGERKVAESRKIKVDKVLAEHTESSMDIELCVTEIDNSIQLLMPHPEDFFISVPEETSSSSVEKTDLPSNRNGNQSNKSNESTHSGKDVQTPDDETRSECDEKVSNVSDSNTNAVSVKSKPGASEDSVRHFSMTGMKNVSDYVQSDVKCENSSQGNKKDWKQEYSIEEKDKEKNSSGNDKSLRAVVEEDKQDDSSEEDLDDDDFEAVGDSINPLRHQLGLFDHTFSITVKMDESGSKVKETEDNKEIIQGLREQYRLVKNKYLPRVKRWIQVLTKNEAEQSNIQMMTDLKAKLEEAARKCLELDVVISGQKDGGSSDSEEDFEDVQEKEGYEEDIPEHVKLEAARSAALSQQVGRGRGRKKRGQGSSKMNASISSSMSYWKLSERIRGEDENDPTTWKSNVRKLQPSATATSTVTSATIKQEPVTPVVKQESGVVKQEPGTSGQTGTNKGSLLETAPIISYGLDLEHWENPDSIKVPMKVKNDNDSRVWIGNSVDDDAKPSSMEVEALTTRAFTFAGKFEPVKWKCRAPLLNGKLCERMDRYKCPFHGKIIARDEQGRPNDPDDTSSQAIKTPAEELAVDMEDRELVADFEAQTGVNLGSSKEKGKGKGKQKAEKRKYPNLTDIKAEKNNSRSRLESKIFKKSTLKKVNAALDAITVKRLADKFGNQFNYSLH